MNPTHSPLHVLAGAAVLAATLLPQATAQQGGTEELWVAYEGGDGPGSGKHIVLVSGDEEYRSEEGLPQLGKILATHHGFKCTVLFPIDAETGEIDPGNQNNIPGLEALDDADLMVILTRFRDLPALQTSQTALEPTQNALKTIQNDLEATQNALKTTQNAI